MPKKVFAAETVPVQQQSHDSPDFTDDSIMPINPYVMRGRMKNDVVKGPWSMINLIPHQYDTDEIGGWATGDNASKLYNQSSNIVTSTGITTYDTTANSYIEYIKSVTINIEGADAINAPITGVDVWLRWMPPEAFNRYQYLNGKLNSIYTQNGSVVETPSESWQSLTWIPNEWVSIGTRYSKSFSVEIPIPAEWREWEEWLVLNGSPGSDTNYLASGSKLRNYRKQGVDAEFPEVWFQILVSAHSTWKPDRYNYLWIGNTDAFVEADFTNNTVWNNIKQEWNSTDSDLYLYKLGDRFIAERGNGDVWNAFTAGYLPWNPYYGAASNIWHAKYRRQRTTFGDIAIFAPKRWRKYFYPEDYTD